MAEVRGKDLPGDYSGGGTLLPPGGAELAWEQCGESETGWRGAAVRHTGCLRGAGGPRGGPALGPQGG